MFFLLKSIDRFGESDEAMYSEQLLKSYEEGDDDLLIKTKSAPMVKFLDTEVITNEWQLFLFFLLAVLLVLLNCLLLEGSYHRPCEMSRSFFLPLILVPLIKHLY